MKKHVIFTSTGPKYFDFLFNHWLKSLKDNVNLENIDVVVLDYDLKEDQRKRLEKQGAILFKCKRDFRVNNIRFRDMAEYLKKHKYDQVLSTDGGDIVFQKDISTIFEKNKNKFRAVCEEITIDLDDFSLNHLFKDFFYEKDIGKIQKVIEGKPMINCGVLYGPRKKFMELCKETMELIKDKNKFGPEQIAINYILYREGFFRLDPKYNFMIGRINRVFHVKDGQILFDDNKLIPVVHNVGYSSTFRAIKNFGYGKDFNKFNRLTFFGIKNFIKLVNFIQKINKKD